MSHARDWFRQAQRDLEHATLARAGGHHDWACFAAQQSAAKAAHAWLLAATPVGVAAWNERAAARLSALGADSEIVARVRLLDAHSDRARLAGGDRLVAPCDAIGTGLSQDALEVAAEVIALVGEETGLALCDQSASRSTATLTPSPLRPPARWPDTHAVSQALRERLRRTPWTRTDTESSE
jgi:HEPN domain-containing protein